MDQPKLKRPRSRQAAPRSANISRFARSHADIGFHEFEIGNPQRLFVTVEDLATEFNAPAGDDPALAWDYDYVRKQVIELAGARRYNLQETFAEAIYLRLAAMRGVKALRVTTSKPDIYATQRPSESNWPRSRPGAQR
jgi:7,8-dihydroneopterin aldolase/epimerase/oxygenase